MMNKFVMVEMVSTISGIGGSFFTTASFKLDNVLAPFSNVPVKIDTGCSISTIPLARFQALKFFCESLKSQDIKNGIHYEISYGVETGGYKHKKPVTYDEKMDCPALKFEHAVSNFQIAGVAIAKDTVFVNYNRKGNILIGMDILKDWDIHMGISRENGTNIFLACPNDKLCQEYSDALEQHFSIRQA